MKGKDAFDFLERICANRSPAKDGGIILGHLLNDNGFIESEITVTRLAPNHFYVLSAAAAQEYDFDQLTWRKRPNEDVTIADVTDDYGVLVLAHRRPPRVSEPRRRRMQPGPGGRRECPAHARGHHRLLQGLHALAGRPVQGLRCARQRLRPQRGRGRGRPEAAVARAAVACGADPYVERIHRVDAAILGDPDVWKSGGLIERDRYRVRAGTGRLGAGGGSLRNRRAVRGHGGAARPR